MRRASAKIKNVKILNPRKFSTAKIKVHTVYCAYVMHVDANINLGKVPYFQIRPNSEKMDEKVNGSAQTALNLDDYLLNYIPVLAL